MSLFICSLIVVYIVLAVVACGFLAIHDGRRRDRLRGETLTLGDLICDKRTAAGRDALDQIGGGK